MKRTLFIITILLLPFLATAKEKIKVGIIGLDTFHSPAFIKHINAEKPEEVFQDFHIVAAYPYGSTTIESSMKKIDSNIKIAEEYGVKITQSIEELLEMVDCVMLETNDGTVHLEQAEKVFKAKKIVFIDKPIGANLAQTIAIVKLANNYNVPFFSSSALRFSANTKAIRDGEHGKVMGADCFSPAANEPAHTDLYWYGIHGVETLFTVMGKGCVTVQATSTEGTDAAIGVWEDGRIGTFRGIRTGVDSFGGTVFCEKKVVQAGNYEGYGKLLENILSFFRTQQVPVLIDETMEIYTFMEATAESKRQGGKPVKMKDVYRKAEKEAKKLVK